MKAHPGQIQQRLLVLVTLGLVAFGLVMVYSATSAAAALGNGDPITFLKRQGIYAAFGVALMVAASRFDNRRLRALAPPLVLVALGLCAAVLVVAPEINGAKRWLDLGPASFQPSELAKLALLVWGAAYLARKGPPQTLGELWRPIGMLACLFCALIMLEPDLGTTVALMLMLGGMLLVAGVPGRTLAAAGGIVLTLGLAAIWIEPYRRARVFSFLDPWADPENSGFQSSPSVRGAPLRARYAAAQTSSASLASSDGWNVIGPRVSQRRAPLNSGATTSTAAQSTRAARTRAGARFSSCLWSKRDATTSNATPRSA